jgi:hypothetical protein
MTRSNLRTARRINGALIAAGLILVLMAPGCASLALLDFNSPKYVKADAKHPAVEMMAVWQTAEGPGPKGVPTRGFAGQIFFFTQDKPAPVAVDGKVRIYLFDDRGTQKEQARPIHQYDYDSAAWNANLKVCNLGPAYNIFIPYPRADGLQAKCALRIKFQPAVGPKIYSPMSKVVLPGPTGTSEKTEATASLQPSGRAPKLPDGAEQPWFDSARKAQEQMAFAARADALAKPQRAQADVPQQGQLPANGSSGNVMPVSNQGPVPSQLTTPQGGNTDVSAGVSTGSSRTFSGEQQSSRLSRLRLLPADASSANNPALQVDEASLQQSQ